jgi:hypothetical protein
MTGATLRGFQALKDKEIQALVSDGGRRHPVPTQRVLGSTIGEGR